jgi:hypothetical protein
MADKIVYFGNSADGTPRTGLTLAWESLLKVSDGTAFTPQPGFTEVGVGFYKFPIPTQDVVGGIDGGAALPTADRFIREILVGPQDTYLDAAVSTRPTLAGIEATTVLAKQAKLDILHDTRIPGVVQPQTGDSFARLGVAGAGLTALGDARVANLDVAVSSRSTYAGGAVASVTADVGITQAGADKVWVSATRTLTAFSTALALSVWDVLETAILAASSIGLKLKTNIDALISTRSTYSGGAVASVTGAVGSVTAGVAVTTNNDKTGYALSPAGVLAIWNQLTADLGIVINSFGIKFKNWALGTDNKALISVDAQDLSATLKVDAKVVEDKTGYSGTATNMVVAPDNASISAIKAKTDNLPLAPAAVGNIPTASDNATAVWANATRTLSSFGTLIADIWAYTTRTLTAFGTLVADIRTGITTDHGTGAYGGSSLIPGINNIVIKLLKATSTAEGITAATKASPCNLTIAAGHGYTNGQKLVLTGIGGMIELNNRLVTVTVVDASNITIGIDSTAFTAYTSGGTATLTDETALQDVSVTIYDEANITLVTTAQTNASGIGTQGDNAYVSMSSGAYVLRPTRSLMAATGDYTFTVSASDTKYFVATALSIPVSGNPDTQVLSGTHTKGGRMVRAVARPGQILPTPAYTIDTEKTETTTAAVAPHTWSLILYRGITYDIVFDKWDKKTITITSAAGAEFTTY